MVEFETVELCERCDGVSLTSEETVRSARIGTSARISVGSDDGVSSAISPDGLIPDGDGVEESLLARSDDGRPVELEGLVDGRGGTTEAFDLGTLVAPVVPVVLGEVIVWGYLGILVDVLVRRKVTELGRLPPETGEVVGILTAA